MPISPMDQTMSWCEGLHEPPLVLSSGHECGKPVSVYVYTHNQCTFCRWKLKPLRKISADPLKRAVVEVTQVIVHNEAHSAEADCREIAIDSYRGKSFGFVRSQSGS